MKNVLSYNYKAAKRFFLKEESYFNFDLPKYFVFENLLDKLSHKIDGKLLSDFYGKHEVDGKQKPTFPGNFENVNYTFLYNKDGKYAWRPFQLIHPAIYVALVHQITKKVNWEFIKERFKEFDKNPKIKCYSLPLESKGKLSDKATLISQWWHSIEQKSIELALDFEYITHSDISDCYGTIYTHSISWALHSKEIGKKERNNKSLLGNIIDKHIQDMSFGQTNGIPQGSVLMDFIAEMVLGYVDLELSQRIDKIKLDDYQIIRYRDDYRIFTNNPQQGELVLKNISEILIELGMKLNTQKTLISKDVVKESIKSDKLYWLASTKSSNNIQEQLLLIHDLSVKFPNSGTLNKVLTEFFERIIKIKKAEENVHVLISIIVDIAYKNPKTYPFSAAILSKLLSLLETKKEKKKILKSISSRFDKIPNTGHLQIWLQRVSILIDKKKNFTENLCKKVIDSSIIIWNSDWLNAEIKKIISDEKIVDTNILKEIKEVIDSEEFALFDSKTIYIY